MPNDYFVKNGWLGTARGGAYYLYNTVAKEFAVFSSQASFDARADALLAPVHTDPHPDFTAPPQFSAVTLTTKCNMECPYCYVKPVSGSGEMTADQAREAVDALAERADGELVLYAWGGEPTQNPEALLAMVQQAQRYRSVKVLLISNGVMDSALLEKLLTFRNLVFQISFDGLISQSRQKRLIARDDSLVKMLDSMETISRVSKRVALRATVTRGNVSELKNCLVPTARRFTNRIILEHLHTFNGRAVAMRHEAPDVSDYTNLIFDLVPFAEEQGIHVKALPLDHLRSGGPNDRMNFLNVLPDGQVTVTNAIIHSSHPDFSALRIGAIKSRHLVFDPEANTRLTQRYLYHYRQQCQTCFARTICHGSVQRYLFLANENLTEWDDLRCRYFQAVIARWIDESIAKVCDFLQTLGVTEGFVRLDAPPGKIHYPMFVMKAGLSLSYRPFQ
ncbi:MAG: radical SAM protein [Eubacteriales bacterium]|nr:radical SAM protein [Eubacteriales bacterium]